MKMSEYTASLGGTRADAGRTLMVQAASYLLTIPREIIIARVLGPGGRGVYVLALLCSQVFSTIFTGISGAVAYHVSKKNLSGARVMADALVLCLIATVLAFGAAAVGSILFRSAASWLPFAAAGSALGVFVVAFNGLYLGRGEIASVNIGQFSLAFFLLVLNVVTLLGLGLGVKGALSSWVGSSLFALAWLWHRSGFSVQQILKFGVSIPGFHSILLFTLRVGGANVVSFLNLRVDAFMVERMIGLRALGIYSIAVAISELLWLLSRSVATACYSRFGRESSSDAAQLAAKAVRLSLFALVLGAIAIGLGGIFLIPLLFGSAFRDAVSVLWILLPGNMVYGVAAILGAYFTNHLGRPEFPLAVTTVALISCFGLSLVLIPRWGMLGGAAASSLSYLVGITLAFHLFVRSTNLGWRQCVLLNGDDWKEQVRLVKALWTK